MNARLLSAPVLSLALLAPAQQALPLPALADATAIHEVAADSARNWDEMLDALAKLDVVFVGETHLDDTTHRVELAILRGLLERRAGKVVLSMEMFERDAQPVLDAYLAGTIDEAGFRAQANAWSNYTTGYRALVETAKAAGIPVVAANFPRSLRRLLMRGGKAAIDRLLPEQRALLPAEIFPASAGYWERVDRAVRGHMGAMGMGGGGTPEERLYATQNLWDNSMGDNVARARAAHPEALVLHVAGGFHVAYQDGTVAQFSRRSPDSETAVVEVIPGAGLELARPDRDRAQGDWLVYTRAIGRGLEDGTHAVATSAPLRYRLAVPEGKAGLPFLIWLPGRAEDPVDAFAHWQAVLADDGALAVVEQPFPEQQADLGLGGRYVFTDGFRAEYGRVVEGIVRIAEYVVRHHGVDPARIVVAGADDGGAVALWAALYGEWLAADFVAIDPADLTRLQMEALPDQPSAARSLRLVARGLDPAALESVAADTNKVGTKAAVEALGDRPLAALLRQWLGLPAAAVSGEPTWLVLENASPRARAWAELYAARLSRIGTAAEVVAAAAHPPAADPARVRRLGIGGDGYWSLDAFAQGQGLPLAGGPFGGTTIVVLPPGTSDADRARWLQFEQQKVLKRRSMFANLAVAELDGDRALPAVLGTLRQLGRSRVLLVPALFCAEPATMRAMKDAVGTAADGMDASWLPGLGGALVGGD